VTTTPSYRPPEGYMTVAQATALLGVAKTTAIRAIREAGLETYTDPRNKRVRLLKTEDVERLLVPVKARAA
jgi:hypothetical protein